VYERDRVAAGASWGNAGRLTPSLAPLPGAAPFDLLRMST
jgi:glycine/D-amino acid oxidase-like deaminating enzyme